MAEGRHSSQRTHKPHQEALAGDGSETGEEEGRKRADGRGRGSLAVVVAVLQADTAHRYRM